MIAALEEFGLADLAQTVNPEVWARTGATFRFGDPPLQVDVLLQLTGVEFHRVEPAAVAGSYGDVPVRFIGLQDLLANKRAAGRPKELADVAALERGLDAAE